jgi:hypothetical protein
MAGKSYIKIGSNNWDRIKKMYVKTGGQTWTAIRKAYVKTNSGWQKVFDTTSNRPFIEGNDIPKLRLNTFRTDSTAGSIIDGTADDPINPVVEAPPVQQMGPTQNPPDLDSRTPPTTGWVGGQGIGRHLWGYNGDWVSGNGSAITYSYDWLFSITGDLNYVEKEFFATSSTGRRDMITNNATHLGRDDGDYFDKNWLIFRVRATNSAGNASAQAAPVYIVRQRPSGTITLINTGVDVPETLSANITYTSRWYNRADVNDSYVEWFAVNSADDDLNTSNRVAIQYLSSISVTGTTTKSGTAFHNATLENKVYVARLTLNNSNTQAPVVPVIGFIPSAPFTVKDSTSPGSEISVTTLNILDYYNQKGTDNRGYIPVGGLFKIQSTVTGVDSSTTYRIRYRMYNWAQGSYYTMNGTNVGSAASTAWTTRTGSSTSFGFGGTLINNITVSGTTATLTHNESINSSLFGSTTYAIDGVGGYDRWQIEIEVSALKNSVRKYYADVVGGIPYYVSRAATSTLSASPFNAQVNENVTLSGSFGGLGGGSSYPRQYRIYYGDGTDSGYLPAGEYSFGTANPSFSVTKQYTATGEYFPYIITMPDYQTTSTSLVVAAALTAPTSTSIVSVSRLNDTQTRVVVSSSGGGGPYYQMFWNFSPTAPTSENRYDAASTTSTVTEDFSFSNGLTYYFYIRSSSENLGNTSTNGIGTAGTFSAYGPSSGGAFYSFASPSGATSSVNGSSTVGSTLTLTANSPTLAAPAASMTSIVWVVNDGGFGGNSFTGGSVLQNGGTTFVIPQFLYGSVSSVGYQIRAEVTWNNGVGSQSANSSAITVTSAATKLTTPTNVAASDNRTDGINITWTNVSNASTYGIWWGNTPGYDSNPDFGGPNNNGGVSITSTPFLDTDAPVGSRSYFVQAFPSTGSTSFLKSDWSAGDPGTRLEALSKLTTPTGVNATDARTDGVNVTWNAVSGAAYYGVWYGGAPGYDSLADFGGNRNTTLITGTSYFDDAIGTGVTRDYYVQAYRSGDPTGTKSNWGGPDSGTRLAPVVNLTAPSIYFVSSGNAGGPVTVYFSGGSGPWYQIWWTTGVGGNSYDEYGSSNPITDNTGPTVAGTYFAYVRSVSQPTNVGLGPSPTISEWSAGYQFTVTSPPPPVSAPATPTGVSLSGSGFVSWSASSGAVSYDVQNYTDRTGSPTNTTNRLGPYVTNVTGTSLQLGSSQGYASPNNWARVQVRAVGSTGLVSTYSAWVPSSTTYT